MLKNQINTVAIIMLLSALTACGGGFDPAPATATDTTAPVITITGNNPETIAQNATYTDAGATASDDTDGTLTVTTTGIVNTATPGSYTITYTATDAAGNVATASRTVNVIDIASQPQNLQAVAGDTQITLSWDTVSNATAYDICHATETITQPENCNIHLNGTLIVDSSSPAVISALTNDTEYFLVVIPKNANGDGTASVVVSAIPVGAVLPTPTGKLNDTGITLCGDYAFASMSFHNNDLDCNLAVDAEGDPIPPGQDALFGRDANASTNNDNDGYKGFSFSKVDNNGFILNDQSANTFHCVKDNVTGLIWEVKQTAVGLHNKDDVYTWFNKSTPTNNGGDSGTGNANASCEGNTDNICNTQTYVTRVNIASLCAASDWRLPTVDELSSLVSYDRSNPTIDAEYFPNTVGNLFWSSSPYAPVSANAWSVAFNNGSDFVGNKSSSNRVRLVRSGQ